ncbi:PhzF family phenazine biosynthesis protein [Rhodoblastus sp.]|uniref:PhzF family phenazine biosynthesis protein n=1 Tax=Rhodoblastus sp. TaxID=1962975 RepID=UPI003F9688C1
MRLAYHLLDVFTETPLAGNPLAVVPEADGLDFSQMQAIAREFNLSETVFVLTPRDPLHTARLRIFTPTQELPFAGHPTIGAACLIALLRAPDMIGARPLGLALEEEIGPVACEVSCYKGSIRARFVAPQTPRILRDLTDKGKIAAALGLPVEDLGFDAHEPVVASAGLAFAFIPVAGRAALNRLAPKFANFGEVFGLERPACCVYSRETSDPAHHVQARVFVPGLGGNEDPATGSAACAFAAVACAFERPEDGEHTIVIEQGLAVGRPSLIALTMQVSGRQLVEASVGGACVRVGEGFLTI